MPPRLGPEQKLLAERHLDHATGLARRYSRRYPRHADEIRSAAYLGLTEAAGRFDPRRGIEFWPYARRRVIGAIKDALIKTIAKGYRHSPGEAPFLTSLDEFQLDGGEADVGSEFDQIEAFERRIALVPERYQPLLRLLFIHDLSMVRAAQSLGISRALASLWYAEASRSLGVTAKRRFRSASGARLRAG